LVAESARHAVVQDVEALVFSHGDDANRFAGRAVMRGASTGRSCPCNLRDRRKPDRPWTLSEGTWKQMVFEDGESRSDTRSPRLERRWE
jgi:hypothetical protein